MLPCEALLERICLLNKLLFFINLVREHLKIKFKEVLGLLVFVLIWLVNLLPQLADISLNLFFGSLVVVTLILEVSNYEEKFLGGSLTKKF